MRKRWNQVRVVIQLVLVLTSSGFMPRITASPEWDHSKPGDGLFLIDFDSNGHVTAVHVIKKYWLCDQLSEGFGGFHEFSD